MQIFVTGASGFVGGAATRALIAHGHKVVAMSRSERSDAAIMDMGASTHERLQGGGSLCRFC